MGLMAVDVRGEKQHKVGWGGHGRRKNGWQWSCVVGCLQKWDFCGIWGGKDMGMVVCRNGGKGILMGFGEAGLCAGGKLRTAARHSVVYRWPLAVHTLCVCSARLCLHCMDPVHLP